ILPATTEISTTSSTLFPNTSLFLCVAALSPAGGGDRLAETGGGDGTTVIAGAAAGLVAVGGGIVLALRRRSGVQGQRSGG
ncbi:LAETG motif-containing sortase-dependent surface protein, partial [Streptomyces sp. NPDC001027]|uniref:LAETG motif-containing sortase-dependent surface protein n=1 Tax=Streptomyces sp. NPDC001027 TaxID=3154771 RepID=UPI0033317559